MFGRYKGKNQGIKENERFAEFSLYVPFAGEICFTHAWIQKSLPAKGKECFFFDIAAYILIDTLFASLQIALAN